MVLPLTCTVNCEAPITVARMRWPGSIDRNVRRAGRAARRFVPPAVVRCRHGPCVSWPKMYSATPPENVMRSGTDAAIERLGQLQLRPERIERRTEDLVDGDGGKPPAIASRVFRSASRFGVVAMPSSCATQLRGIIDARPRAFGVAAPAGVRRPRRPTRRRSCRWSISASLVVPPPISTCSTHASRCLRQRDRAGAVRGERAFELVAGGGADEFSGFGRRTVRRWRARSSA